MTLNELDLLKQKADLMGIKYKSNIGIEALKAKINAHLDGTPEPDDEDAGQDPDTKQPEKQPTKAPEAPKQETEAQLRKRLHDECMALVRVRITCLNPAKAALKGEIITVANRYIGNVRKMVPFGEQTDEGYHVPRVLLEELKSRKFNSVTTKKGPNGQMLPVQRLVPEFAIEELPPLTEEELADLAAAQAAAKGG